MGIGRTGMKAEKKASARLGGRLMPGSGAMVGAKGDLKLNAFLVENKSTVTDSFSVSLDHLAKIQQEAITIGKNPALAVQFTMPNGEPRRYGAWVMVPEALWDQIVEATEDQRSDY